nr:hypothetical protein CFP56_03984 [Quercus suber]
MLSKLQYVGGRVQGGRRPFAAPRLCPLDTDAAVSQHLCSWTALRRSSSTCDYHHHHRHHWGPPGLPSCLERLPRFLAVTIHLRRACHLHLTPAFLTHTLDRDTDQRSRLPPAAVCPFPVTASQPAPLMASALPLLADHLCSLLPCPPLPSPASLSDALLTPPLADPASTLPWAIRVRTSSAADLGLTAAIPEPVNPMEMLSVVTPPIDRPEPDMNMMVGGALAPVPSPTPARSPARLNPGLQLPSFDSLGIAVPRPGSVGAIRRVSHDPSHQLGNSSRSARMSGRDGLASTASCNFNAAIFNDAELEAVLQARSSDPDGITLPDPKRSARLIGTRSMNPLSTRYVAGLGSASIRPAIDGSRHGATQIPDRDTSDSIPSSMVQKHDILVDRRNQPELPLPNMTNDLELPYGPVFRLPSCPSTCSSLPIQSAHNGRELPLTPPQESTDHNWDSIPVPNQVGRSPPKGDRLSDTPPRPGSARAKDSMGSIELRLPVAGGTESTRETSISRSDPMAAETNRGESEWEFVDHITATLGGLSISSRDLPVLTDSTPQDHGAAIRVWYLIRKGVPCGDGPVSPPTTPRSNDVTEDYFSPKIYDFLARTPDYQTDQPALRGTPNNVLPLASINVSVVERYIPPTNQNEARQLFDTHGLSTLVDRMTELSSNSGCLVFIYPTKTGGQTFMSQYLDPVLGPILRSTMVVNNLSADLSTSIGTMTAVSELPEYASLRYQMHDLCGRLSHVNAAASRFRGVKARFDVVYEAVQTITLDRDAWTDWWTRQEKARIREVVTKYLHAAATTKRPSSDYGQRLPHAAELSQQIMAAVESREYTPGTAPVDGVEPNNSSLPIKGVLDGDHDAFIDRANDVCDGLSPWAVLFCRQNAASGPSSSSARQFSHEPA